MFGPHMRPLTRQAAQLGKLFAYHVVYELRRRNVYTYGLPVPARIKDSEGMQMLKRTIGEENLLKLLARVYFWGKKRTEQDYQLCKTLAHLAVVYGIIEPVKDSHLLTGGQ